MLFFFFLSLTLIELPLIFVRIMSILSRTFFPPLVQGSRASGISACGDPSLVWMRCSPPEVPCLWWCYTYPTTATVIWGHQLGSNLPSVFNASKQAHILLCISAAIKGVVLLGGALLTAHRYLRDLPFHQCSEQLSSARQRLCVGAGVWCETVTLPARCRSHKPARHISLRVTAAVNQWVLTRPGSSFLPAIRLPLPSLRKALHMYLGFKQNN